MKPNANPPWPAQIEECYRAFIPRKNYHPPAPLTFEELWEEMPETVRYVGGEQDFKIMLPRFFELAWQVVEKDEYLDLYPLSPLSYCKWQSWPAEQRLAIENCSALLWRETLERKNDWNASEILSAVHSMGLSWLPFLGSWFSSSCPASAIESVIPTVYSSRLSKVQQWLCHPRVLSRVETDFFAATDPEEASDISRVHDLLRFHCSQTKSK